MNKQINYGVDAPGVIRNLLVIGAAAMLLFFFMPVFKIGNITFSMYYTFLGVGIVCIAEGLLMIYYAKAGKFRHRDKMLALHEWNGSEKVLDVGTGRGLMMIGAAKKLSTGKAIGIDIWNKEDLTDNNKANAEANAVAEGVADKIDVQDQNIIKTSFADNEFDVIVSNLCLHNIYNKEKRKEACAEIARILNYGGTAILSDFKHTAEYAANFKSMGLSVEKSGPDYLRTFPPLAILKIKKGK